MTRYWWCLPLAAGLLAEAGGCVPLPRRPAAPADANVIATAYRRPTWRRPAPPRSPVATPRIAPSPAPAPAPISTPDPVDLAGPRPVDAFIRRALAENRTVQAAHHNVLALRYRIPQVTTLDDPVASNAIFPIPSVAPQYSLMGYNPYNLTLAQQFPWFGTLRLRGEVADGDVRVALAELAAAQLDAVAAVKRSYCDLYAAQRTADFLAENRKLLEDFRAVARQRVATGGAQADVLRAEVLISELDREAATNQAAIVTARAALARQAHLHPEADLQTLPTLPTAAVPAEVDRLVQLAGAARPELRGRLAAVARDEKAVELARQRFYPSTTLGLTYMDMEKTNAATPLSASGAPNVGLFVAFSLPVYRGKYRAGVCEARERARADAKLYEAQQDETHAEVVDLLSQARVQQGVLGLLRDQILPRTRQTLANAGTDYAGGNVDFAALIGALRGVLQVELQAAQVEAELGKALAALERAVGCQLNEHPPAPAAPAEAILTPPPPPPPPPASAPGPFRRPGPGEAPAPDAP